MRFIYIMTILGFSTVDMRLIYHLLRMNIQDRYLGSYLGRFWAVFQPLMLFGMYTFIFGFVFKAKAPGSDTTLSYVIWLISGFAPFLAVSEAINSSASSLVSGAVMIKNINFKSECLVFAAVLSAFVPLMVGMIFLVGLLAWEGRLPGIALVAIPLVLVLQTLFLCGLGLFLSATTVFLRDVSHVIPSAMMFWMFFTPIFYSVDMLPGLARRMTFFNPLFHVTQFYRSILLENSWPDWEGTIFLALVGLFLFTLGLKYFRRLKGYFDSAL